MRCLLAFCRWSIATHAAVLISATCGHLRVGKYASAYTQTTLSRQRSAAHGRWAAERTSRSAWTRMRFAHARRPSCSASAATSHSAVHHTCCDIAARGHARSARSKATASGAENRHAERPFPLRGGKLGHRAAAAGG